jgi:hypothetical protein
MTPTTSPTLAVACPICDAPAGQPCRNLFGDYLPSPSEPHVSPVLVSREMAR